MKWISRYGLVAYLLLLMSGLAAQEPESEKSIEKIIESIIEGLEEGTDASVITEDLQELAENPLNLNEATSDDLKKLFFLDQVLIRNFQAYRDKFGQIYSLNELLAVEGFSNEIIQKMSPFIRIDPPKTMKKSLAEAFRFNDHQLLLRNSRVIQQTKGYEKKEDGSASFAGDPNRYYVRYKIANERFSGGFIAEKDPGEAFFRKPEKQGFDFYSFYSSLSISKTIETLTIGDFIIRSGQGLVVWQGYSPGKSIDVLNISKTNQGIRPSTSGDENRFFRGVSTSLILDKINLQLFFSSKKDDANLAADESGNTIFTSLQTSGYHRTINEIEDEKSVRHTNTGLLGSLNLLNLKIGATIMYEKFGYPFIRTPQLYNLFYLKGTENLNLSLDYQFYYKKLNFFGEAARSQSGGMAFVQGLVARLDDRANFSFLFRHFDRDYQSVWGNSFSENTMVTNETGFYSGIRILPIKRVTVSAYADFYRFPWITFATMAPSAGVDIQVQADIKLPGNTLIYFRFKNEEKEMKTWLEERYVNIPEKLQRFRVHADYEFSGFFGMHSRYEACTYKGKSVEYGQMFFQDLVFSPARVPVKAVFRVAWFDTDSYNTAIYAYENDVLYSFSIPAYYGKGLRFFINLKYRMMRNLDLWFRVGHSVYSGQKSIGSGNDMIIGNMKTDIKFQLRLTI